MKKNPNIKAKIIVGYSLTIIILIVSGYITYHSFTMLVNSVETLSKPDDKLIRLNHMITDISETERNLRSYILSDDKSHMELYQANLDSIKYNLDRLKAASIEEPDQLIKLDSIEILLNAKYDALDELGNLQKRSTSFSSVALKRIREAPVDSGKFDTTLTTYTETIRHIPPVPEVIIEDDAPEEEPAEEKGLFNAIKNLFGGKKEEMPQQEEIDDSIGGNEFYTETKVTVDTSIVAITQPDTVVANIRKILSDMQKKESALNRLLTAKQLEILEQDRLIMDKLRVLLTGLERAEIINAERQTEAAKKIAGKFSFTILAIGIFGLLVGTIFILLIIHDINRSNYLKIQLEKAKERAEFLAKVKEEFLSNMSHEIRTPLNAILGFTEQLLMTPLQQQQNRYLQSVHQSSTHLLSTVNDILDYSKIEAGKLSIEKIPFNLRSVIKEVHELLRLKADEKQLFFHYFVDEDCPQGLLGDPFRLKQILFNLIGNALKFTDQGSVSIICKCQTSFVSHKKVILSIAIKDTGIGISEDKISRIFEDFQQADSSTTREYGGTGLGLTISKKLARLQNGSLEVESEEGKGSTFTVIIPYEICNVEELEVREIESEVPETILEGKKVLIIDDDAVNLLLLSTILGKYKATAVQSKNGSEGISKSQRTKFDLIITDIQMPKMSGFEFAEMLRADEENTNVATPIFALSAHVSAKEMAEADRTGITRILSKPYKESNLLHQIVEVLGLSYENLKAAEHAGHDQEIEVPVELDKLVDTDCNVDYSGFESFIRGDKNALIALLNTLVKDQKSNLKLLKQYYQRKDMPETAALAHKMRASFAYLKADQLVEKLKKIETGLREDANEELLNEIPGVLSEVEKIVSAIELSIEKLQEEIVNQPS